MLRKSQWISGFEFFEISNEDYSQHILDLISFYEVEFPNNLIQYLKHFKPIEMWDDKMYVEGTNFISSKYEMSDEVVVNQNFNQFLPFYSVVEIKERVLNWDPEISKIFKNKKLVPICQSVPNGDIVVSIESNHTKGKLYYVIDHFELNKLDDLFFCNSLFDFITGISEVPRI